MCFFPPQDLQLFLAPNTPCLLFTLCLDTRGVLFLCPLSLFTRGSPGPPGQPQPSATHSYSPLPKCSCFPCAPHLHSLLHSPPSIYHRLAHFMCNFLILIIACVPVLGSSSIRAGSPVCLVHSCGPPHLRVPGPSGLPGNIQQGKRERKRGRKGESEGSVRDTLGTPVCQHQ